MTRGISAATLTAIEADTATPIYFVELGPFQDTSPETTERMHSGLGTITWGGFNWLGVGNLGAIEGIRESNALRPEAVRLTVSGVTTEMLDLVYNTNYFRRPCKIYLGALSAGALIEDPSVTFSGFIESIDATMGDPDGDKIVVTAENELIVFKRSRDVLFTDNQLQSEYSGDLGFQYLEAVMNQKVEWRGQSNSLGGQGSRGVPLPGGDGGGEFPNRLR